MITVEKIKEEEIDGNTVTTLLLNGRQEFLVEYDGYDDWVQITGEVHEYHLGSYEARHNPNCVGEISLVDNYKFLNSTFCMGHDSYYFTNEFEKAVQDALFGKIEITRIKH